jgi:hypothetical protein
MATETLRNLEQAAKALGISNDEFAEVPIERELSSVGRRSRLVRTLERLKSYPPATLKRDIRDFARREVTSRTLSGPGSRVEPGSRLVPCSHSAPSTWGMGPHHPFANGNGRTARRRSRSSPGCSIGNSGRMIASQRGRDAPPREHRQNQTATEACWLFGVARTSKCSNRAG